MEAVCGLLGGFGRGWVEFVAEAGHGVEVEGEVVDGTEGAAEGFAGVHEVAEIGAGVALAGGAGAVGVGREGVVGEAAVFDVHAAFAGEEESVSCGAGGDDAVHHVDAHAGVFDDLVGVADAHDVTGLVGGEQGEGFGDDLACEFARLADAEAADGVSVEVHCDEALGGFAAEMGIHAALDDAEEGLGLSAQLGVPGNLMGVGAEVSEGASGPEVCDAEGFAGAFFGGGIFGALVEGHADVGTEGELDVDGVFGGEEMAGAVEVRAEADAFVGEFAQAGEGEDLESAGVGEQGAGPGDEAMESAEGADAFMAGAEIEVIGVAEDDLRAEVFEGLLRDGFDGALSSDGHEDGGFDGAVGQVDARAAGAGGVCGKQIETKRHRLIVAGGGAALMPC